ncbi:MAG TPA: D-alanyl-D-alanine carboxypeptidase/D-alanyl-D-alanine-endopeptidase [Candidatus Kapabacteria bacterium]|nr:D-alanyl-D-alanine carboxypeptidase/D-alanyl-D-alanine-endopeptidase [Candidatus Kapabacteria bacterium]
MTKQAQGQGLERLRHDLDSLFSDTAFSNATFGVAIQSLKTGEYLYRRNDTKSLLPASNMKLFTTAEALALLGPEYRYKTELLTNGPIKRHTLYGNLIIRGVGDPTFSDWGSPFFDTGLNIHREWPKLLRRIGVRRILGSITIDNSFFTPERYAEGWQLDDAAYYYATPITALADNENQVALSIFPDSKVGKLATVGIYRQPIYGILRNHAVTGDTSSPLTIDAGRMLCSDTITIRGMIPQLHPEVTERVSIDVPERYATDDFGSSLEYWGHIKQFNRHLRRHFYKKIRHPKILASYSSRPLRKIIHAMNKESDNFIAECLFRTVAKVIGGEGSWTRGIAVMRKYLATLGIDTTRLQFTDGSGLSRMDLVTADDIVTVLRAMASNPKLDSAFYNSLPIMGVDGTLENRLKGTPAQGNVQAKTGSMTGVRAVSGYLTTRDGEQLAFSILANNYTVSGSEIGKLEDEVLLKLVNFSRK